jgi:hypothetical protein
VCWCRCDARPHDAKEETSGAGSINPAVGEGGKKQMGKHFKSVSIFSIALVVAWFSLLAPLRMAADNDDPPSRVARLGYAGGSVSFQPAGTDEWVSAIVNRPVTTGDKLWADNDSRAELHIGSASIRIAGNTGFSFLNLTDDVTQIQLTAGTLRVRVKRMDENERFEVDTPNLAFSVLRPGVYRINVSESGNATLIKVRSGEGEVTGGGSAYTVHAREAGAFTGTDELNADVQGYGNDDDDFDTWCATRDRHEDLSVSARYVSPDVIGYQDLDDYGGWRLVPEYGNVWFPHTTIVGWAPYRYGHWAYVYPWGYTWIDDAPWGFAPFHYGRWISYNGVWGWVPCPPRAPGVVYVRPVYAPALVAWVGGPHFGVGLSVGWFPLGPREVYVPSYPVSRTYVNNVNVSNTTVNTTVINNYYNSTVINKNTTAVNNNVNVVHQTYVNQTVAGAVTATTPQAFTSAQSVSKNVVAVNQKEVATASVNALTPSVAPAKQAVLGAGAAATVKPPVAIEGRAVVAKATPPPPPVPFAKQEQAIKANGGNPLAISQVRQMQPATAQAAHPSVKIAPPAKPQNVEGGKPGRPQSSGSNQPGQAQLNSSNKPATTNNGGQPGNNGSANPNSKALNDRPPSARPNGGDQPGQAQTNNSNRPGATNNAGQLGNNGTANPDSKTPNDRPPSARPNGGDQPGQAQTNNGNKPTTTNNAGQPGNNGTANPNNKTPNDRPPSARANSGGNNAGNSGNQNNAGNRDKNVRPELDQKHQQELEQLRTKQDQERQKVEQQQQQERQRLAQKNADDLKQQQLNQKHQEQLQSLEKKHDSEQQKLQQKQQDEKRKKASPEKDDPSHNRS